MVDAMRWIRHWFHAPASRAFPPETMQRIQKAIAEGETTHDGEICFAVEARLPARFLIGGRHPRARAEHVFADLRVWDTERRTGVLIYILLADRTIEIVADRGINARVPAAAWDRVTALMTDKFRQGDWEAGALAGINAAHVLLTHRLPRTGAKRDELTDQPIIL
jgi:uncharacterized membrane protein